MASSSANDATVLIFYVNGQKIVEEKPDPEETLINYLRRKLLLTGTKLACGQGACGSCTVMVSHYQRANHNICHRAMTSCLVPVCSLHGMSVTTVEGVGSVNTKLHPIQEQLVQAHGTQCGFCTPGFVMSMYALLRTNPRPSIDEVHRAIKGNLCRCTGYRPILDGFRTFTKEYCPMGDQCCKRTSNNDQTETKDGEEPSLIYDPSQDAIFPSELQLSDELDKQTLVFGSGLVTWLRPVSLRQLLRLKSQYPTGRIIAGNTTVGLEQNQDKHNAVMLSVSMVPELTQIITVEGGITFGAAVTMADIEEHILVTLEEHPDDEKYQSCKALRDMLDQFAALQIKNMVTLGGCIASAWSNSDVLPLFCALKATVCLASHGGPQTTVLLKPDFFKGPGETLLKNNQVIVTVTIPFLKEGEFAYSLKQSRRDFDTAILSTAALITHDKGTDTITDFKVYLGNVLPSVFFAENLSNSLVGKPCSLDLASAAMDGLQRDISAVDKIGSTSISTDLRTLIESSIWRLTMQVVRDVKGLEDIPADVRLAIDDLHVGNIQGTRVYEEVPPDQPVNDAVGRPIVHRAARQQATGEALYIDDTPHYENELYLALVTSTRGHARIIDVDTSEALLTVGVVDVVTHKDVPGKNSYGMKFKDELIFSVDEVRSYGEIIAGVLATSHDVATKAAKLVDVTYEALPCITTIQEAIEAKSFYEGVDSLQYGSMAEGFSAADEVVEGEVETGGQEHFYMETTCALAIPMKEDQEIKIFVPTQSPLMMQPD